MNEGYSELDLCPMCLNVSVVTFTDENEKSHCRCRRCGWNSDDNKTVDKDEQP